MQMIRLSILLILTLLQISCSSKYYSLLRYSDEIESFEFGEKSQGCRIALLGFRSTEEFFPNFENLRRNEEWSIKPLSKREAIESFVGPMDLRIMDLSVDQDLAKYFSSGKPISSFESSDDQKPMNESSVLPILTLLLSREGAQGLLDITLAFDFEKKMNKKTERRIVQYKKADSYIVMTHHSYRSGIINKIYSGTSQILSLITLGLLPGTGSITTTQVDFHFFDTNWMPIGKYSFSMDEFSSGEYWRFFIDPRFTRQKTDLNFRYEFRNNFLKSSIQYVDQIVKVKKNDCRSI
ncbi:hypothetical protein EHQ27_12245 [Leptospira wolffii]|uniref:hypothetical protein n=1 Tax=Leptospira wolffii TaxID=409998 RepID=UPI001082C2EC|nr:hypothetical protein [Leptospira wolffii]TGK62534.1 hypothetical protein EHQ32_06885 [Leptospira wolffii]TGK70398.1 hypothetical protein EHQ27_12245 [Leptospira wolffii]TGK74081.1 hypothetical protein EHQ35_06885 [Leptospira wolffii]TGL28940.1 hypothetical protein EHQ57_13405 [Leptospira wolffii]